jgi:hypothetical protein
MAERYVGSSVFFDSSGEFLEDPSMSLDSESFITSELKEGK